MKNKLEKNDLIFNYQEADFPKNLIAKDVLIHRELIFNDEGEAPELSKTKKKIKYSSCFILEEEIDPKGKSGFKKGTAKPSNKPIHKSKEIVWRKNEPEENSGGFFDDFKGRSDEKQVAQFKRNLEVFVSNENSISIEKSVFIIHPFSKDQKTDNTIKYYEPNNSESNSTESVQSISVDSLFDDLDTIITAQVAPKQQSKLSEVLNKIDPNPRVVNIEQLFKINEFLNYPKEEQLWYIFHPVAKSSFGPLSSPNIKEMYDSKMLTGQSEVRFIDIYNLKNKKPFSFFLLKEIEHPNFLDEIDISPLLKVAISIKSKYIKENKEIAVKTEKKLPVTPNPVEITQLKDLPDKSVDKPVDKPKEKSKVNPKPIISNTVNNVPIIQEPAKKIEVEKKSNVDNRVDSKMNTDNKSNIENVFEDTTISQKKSKKIPKGKPIEVDLKLGFKIDEEVKPKSTTISNNLKNTVQPIPQQTAPKNKNYGKDNNKEHNIQDKRNNYPSNDFYYNQNAMYNQNNEYYYDNNNYENVNYDYNNNFYEQNDYGAERSIYSNYKNNNYYKK